MKRYIIYNDGSPIKQELAPDGAWCDAEEVVTEIDRLTKENEALKAERLIVANNIAGSPADIVEWSKKVGEALSELDISRIECDRFAQCCLGKDHPCPLNVNDGYCCAVSCQYRVIYNKELNHKEG